MVGTAEPADLAGKDGHIGRRTGLKWMDSPVEHTDLSSINLRSGLIRIKKVRGRLPTIRLF